MIRFYFTNISKEWQYFQETSWITGFLSQRLPFCSQNSKILFITPNCKLHQFAASWSQSFCITSRLKTGHKLNFISALSQSHFEGHKLDTKRCSTIFEVRGLEIELMCDTISRILNGHFSNPTSLTPQWVLLH